jgi:hypothetical protein
VTFYEISLHFSSSIFLNITKEGNREQGTGNREQGIGDRGQGAGGRGQIRNTHLHQFRASVKKKMFLQDA